MEELKSRRGKMQFSHGYIYVFDRSSEDKCKMCWRCQLTNECKARLHTAANFNEVVTQIIEHWNKTQGKRINGNPASHPEHSSPSNRICSSCEAAVERRRSFNDVETPK